MRLTSVAPHRNTTLGLVFLLVFVLGSVGFVLAQNPPAQQTPPAQQAAQPAKPAVAFEGDLGELLIFVKPDKGADFEALLARVKEGLTKLDTVETKQQASTMRFYKAPLAPNATVAIYAMIADPPIKGSEYWFLSILYKAFPTEGQAILDKWNDIKSTQGPQKLDLTLVK
jgi:hypothetical protein